MIQGSFSKVLVQKALSSLPASLVERTESEGNSMLRYQGLKFGLCGW